MDSNFVTAQVDSVTTEISNSLTGYIPLILVIFAALIGLGMGIRYFRKYITGRKF